MPANQTPIVQWGLNLCHNTERNSKTMLSCQKTAEKEIKPPARPPAGTHGDDDDAGLVEDVLGQVVEDGVGVVGEGLQLLAPFVQVDEGSHVLVEGVVHCRGLKLDGRVVFPVGVLSKT